MSGAGDPTPAPMTTYGMWWAGGCPACGLEQLAALTEASTPPPYDVGHDLEMGCSCGRRFVGRVVAITVDPYRLERRDGPALEAAELVAGVKVLRAQPRGPVDDPDAEVLVPTMSAGGVRPARPDGLDRIGAEARRVREEKGYTFDHDDHHVNGELSDTAVAYIWGDPEVSPWGRPDMDDRPEDPDADRLDRLVKAGQLVAAEIDRILRARPDLP